MLYSIVFIIVGFEIIDFIIRAILPNGKLDSTITNAVNMIIFAGIIMLCVSMITDSSMGLFPLNKFTWSKDINHANFNDYINTYKQIISKAME